jgi:hypothetical protein
MKHLTHSKKLALIVGPLVLIVVVAVLTVYIVDRFSDSRAKPQAQAATVSNPVQTVRSLVANKYASSLRLNEQIGSAVYYQVGGYDFTTMDAKNVTDSALVNPVSASPNAVVPDTLLGDITSTLTAMGYTRLARPPFDARNLLQENYHTVTYTKGNSVCMWLEGVGYSGFTCTDQMRLKRIAQAAQPFAVSLAAAQHVKVGQLALGNPRVAVNQKNQQYTHASLPFTSPSTAGRVTSLDQAAAYFYTPVGTRTWTFSTVSQEGLSCPQLSGVAAQAFSDICSPDGY